MNYLTDMQFELGEHEDQVRTATENYLRQDWVNRLWRKDTTLWVDSPDDKQVLDRLGWLNFDLFVDEQKHWSAVVESALDGGFENCFLIGMGGSSLAPEVFKHTFGSKSGFFEFDVLDNTASTAIKRLTKRELKETLFIVSSKSGSTIETDALQSYYFNQVQESGVAKPGDHFIAITDQGSRLQKLAQKNQFRSCFVNPSDIGGRYSALSHFGLLPATLLGIDTSRLLQNCCQAKSLFTMDASWEHNPGFRLGVALGELAKLGRDKLTLLLADEFQRLGNWIEQLVAESTGKQGCGIVPIVSEPRLPAEQYADDRIFVSISFKCEPEDDQMEFLEALKHRGHPVIQWALPDLYALGTEFFLWEVATAFAGAVLAINPFDEPNVQESKQITGQLLKQAQILEADQDYAPKFTEQGLSFFDVDSKQNTAKECIGNFLNQFRHGDYVSILAYLPKSVEFESCGARLRELMLRQFGTATTTAYGPRYLHSTGQLHKGGKNNGVYFLITVDHPDDIVIPGKDYTFNQLNRAQALGDYQVLKKHQRRVLRIHLESGIQAGLITLEEIFREVLGVCRT